MADLKISQMSDAASLTGNEVVPLVQSGGNVKATTNVLKDFISLDVSNMTDTWNDANTTFKSISMDVTDTSSASDSLLMDLQVNGSSKFKIAKNGNITMPDNASITNTAAGNNNNGWKFDVGSLTYVLGGANRFTFAGGQLRAQVGGSIGWTNSSSVSAADLVITRDAANTLAQRNSTNAQTFNLYGTYTDASNYERGFLKWNSDVFEIGTERDGTGLGRNMQLQSAGGLNLFSNTGTFKIGGVEGVSSTGTLNFGIAGKIVFGNSSTNYTGQHAAISRAAQNVLAISGESGGGSLQLSEMTAPPGAANTVRIYADDDGVGNTRLMSRFATGAPEKILSGAVEWNDALTTFTGIKYNVTDTASASGSLLMDLQVGGGTAFEVNKTGRLRLAQPGVSTSSIIFQPYGHNLSLQIYSGTAINFSAFNGMLQPYGNRIVIGNSYTAGAQLWRDGVDNVLALRNGANAQTFNLYNTYTDASNYERGFLKWNAGTLEIGTEASGSGAGRNINIVRGGSNIVQVSNIAVRFYQPPQPVTAGSTSLGVSTKGWSSLYLQESSTDPADPTEGESVLWQSDGTGTGDDGDIMMKITAGGVTKIATLVDFSALP